jgi:hypothetical protein
MRGTCLGGLFVPFAALTLESSTQSLPERSNLRGNARLSPHVTDLNMQCRNTRQDSMIFKLVCSSGEKSGTQAPENTR